MIDENHSTLSKQLALASSQDKSKVWFTVIGAKFAGYTAGKI